MAAKSNNGAKKNVSSNGRPPFGYINYELTVQDKEWLASSDVDAEFPPRLIDELVMEGYKFSLSFDERNSTCIASLTDRQVGGAFENQCLTGRGATPLNAIHSLLYRHLVVASGDWSVFNRVSKETAIYG